MFPSRIRLKQTELTTEQRRLANFVDFIGEGRGSRTLAQALFESERKVGALKEELESLHRCRAKVFQVPPIEWIQERLAKLKEILERNSDRSGVLLRKLLGPRSVLSPRAAVTRIDPSTRPRLRSIPWR